MLDMLHTNSRSLQYSIDYCLILCADLQDLVRSPYTLVDNLCRMQKIPMTLGATQSGGFYFQELAS